MLIISFLLYLILSLIITLRAFNDFSFEKLIIIIFLVSVSLNIFIMETLSFFHSLDDPILFMTLQLILCFTFSALLFFPGKKEIIKIINNYFETARKKQKLTFLFFLILLILGGSLFIGKLIPINNSDSLSSHLPRIYYWVQHGSFKSWISTNVYQISYPINIPIQGLWFWLLSHSEKLFFLTQWIPLIVSVVVIGEIAILLKCNKYQAKLAQLISLSIPIVLLQTYSLQGDLFIATLILVVVYFLMMYIEKKNPLFLFISSFAFSISLGSKQTAFVILPMYLLFISYLFVYKKINWDILKKFGISFLIFFIVTSSYKFFQNLSDPKINVNSMFSSIDLRISPNSIKGYQTNTLRYLYQGFSLDGIPGSMKVKFTAEKNRLFQNISRMLDCNLESLDFIANDHSIFSYSIPTPLNEDAAWFGPLFSILIIPTIVVCLLSKNKICRYYLFFVVFCLATFFLSLVFFKGGWGPNRGRYLLIPILLFSPLTAFVFPENIRVSKGIVSLFGLIPFLLAFSVLLMNDSRPIITKREITTFQTKIVEITDEKKPIQLLYRKIWYKINSELLITAPNRESILTLTYYDYLYFQNTVMANNINFINSYIDITNDLFLFIDPSVIEYALFGIDRTRNLYPVEDLEHIPSGAYALVSIDRASKQINGFQVLGSNSDYMILKKE